MKLLINKIFLNKNLLYIYISNSHILNIQKNKEKNKNKVNCLFEFQL